MGSGSSKEEKKPEPPRVSKKEEPVANVNNHGPPANNKTTNAVPETQTVQKTFITQPDESVEEKNNHINTNGKGLRDEEPVSEVRAAKRTTQDSFVWHADRETEEELNEMLQIPTDNRQSSRPVPSVDAVRQQDLPETYAQRKQREQYTLNQQMLLRQKTIYRNPDDWRNEEEEEQTGKGGFDPTKFRSANKGQTMKSTVFTTSTKQDGNIQYMPGQQNMDEFDVIAQQKTTPREIPTYNQSEQDLMASLERDLM